jgi:hypothetical protein
MVHPFFVQNYGLLAYCIYDGENGLYTIDNLSNGSFAIEQSSSACIPNTIYCLYTTDC